MRRFALLKPFKSLINNIFFTFVSYQKLLSNSIFSIKLNESHRFYVPLHSNQYLIANVKFHNDESYKYTRCCPVGKRVTRSM